MRRQYKKPQLLLRLVFDTNIYGMVIEQDADVDILEKIEATTQVIVYGARTVRNELRNTPRARLKGRHKLRLLLLNFYDRCTRGKELPLTSAIEELAKAYFSKYTQLGGSRNWRLLRNDMLIVATASYYDVDVVVTQDNKTMLSKEAVNAYIYVNKTNGMRQPDFIGLEEFKILLKKYT